jgi:hypothetical protein
VQLLVLEQRLHDERARLLARRREREQLLFFLAEVRHGHLREERRERSRCRDRIGAVCGATQAAGLYERVLMVVREMDQRGMALHHAVG